MKADPADLPNDGVRFGRSLGTAVFEGDIGGALLKAAEAHAARPALWALGHRLTYADLFDRAARIAAAIDAAGVRPGERVAILCRRNATAYASVLGVLLAGCSYMPLNTAFPKLRNQSMLQDAAAAALIVDEACADKLESLLEPLDAKLPVIRPEAGDGALEIGGRPVRLPDGEGPAFRRSTRRPAGRDQLAYLLFTSGTTGRPKGVPITHANLAAYLAAIARVWPTRDDDRVMQIADLTWDLSVHDMFTAWLNGAELYSMPENTTAFAPRAIAQHGLTTGIMVPSAVARMLEKKTAKPGSMPSLRVTYFCGEALPRSVAEGWQAAAPNSRIVNIYGPTEATVVVCAYDLRPDQAGELPVVPLGPSFGDQKVALFTPDGRNVPPGEVGEICISGTQVMSGYWGDAALTDQKIVTIGGERWYRTGDLGRRVEPHGFLFAGRADRQVKVRGFRVELQEIESVVRRVTGREQVAVIAWPRNHLGDAEGFVAFVCGPEADTGQIRSGCRAIVADYMVPDRVVFLPEMPVNANGKVDYRSLAEHPSLSPERQPTTDGAGSEMARL